MRLAGLFCMVSVLAGTSVAQDTNFSTGPQYLMTSGSPMFARSLATPSLSLQASLPPIPSLPQFGPTVSQQPYLSDPELNKQADLLPIYYGYPMLSAVMLISEESPRELPESIVGVGVVRIVDADSLRESGYGISLAQAASLYKAHKSHGTHVFTNADIERLHGG